MSEKKHTAGDLIRAARFAYVEGRVASGSERYREMYTEAAKRLYPFPKIPRPRIATTSAGYQYKIEDGLIYTRADAGDNWIVSNWPARGVIVGALNPVELDELTTILDLLKNPTELVEDDE